MKAYFCDQFVLPLPPGHRFPMQKYKLLRDEIARGEVEWTKESIIETYNALAKAVSATFPEFLLHKLNV